MEELQSLQRETSYHQIDSTWSRVKTISQMTNKMLSNEDRIMEMLESKLERLIELEAENRYLKAVLENRQADETPSQKVAN